LSHAVEWFEGHALRCRLIPSDVDVERWSCLLPEPEGEGGPGEPVHIGATITSSSGKVTALEAFAGHRSGPTQPRASFDGYFLVTILELVFRDRRLTEAQSWADRSFGRGARDVAGLRLRWSGDLRHLRLTITPVAPSG
jgi:hypothetical protein